LSEIEVQIVNRLGLHARAAAKFVHLANGFECRVSVCQAESRVDGKSILGLLTLAARQGARLRLCTDGPDEQAALAGLAGLIRDRFGEVE